MVDEEKAVQILPFVGKTLRIFISYSHKNKKIAGAVKDAFNQYGMEAFLAHEDIAVGLTWRDVILRNLKQHDVFVALLSKEFLESFWTNQEVGFAISRGTLIVPVSLDSTLPVGFLEMFQALTKFEVREYTRFNSKELYLDCVNSVFEIIKIIASKPELSDSLKDSLIRSMANQQSYASAEKHFDVLMPLQPFSKEQLNEIVNQSILNNQIHNANKCRTMIKDLLSKQGADVDSEKKSELMDLIEPF